MDFGDGTYRYVRKSYSAVLSCSSYGSQKRLQRLELRGPGYAVTARTVVQRLDPDAIARQEQSMLSAVMNAERIHPLEPVQQPADPPLPISMQHDFRIARCAELMCRRKLPSKQLVVVDLPVDRNDDSAVFAHERLACALGQIENAQSPVPDIDTGTGPIALLIGPPGCERAQCRVRRPEWHATTRAYMTEQAAHLFNSEQTNLIPSNRPAGQGRLDNMGIERPAELGSDRQLQFVPDDRKARGLQVGPQLTLTHSLTWNLLGDELHDGPRRASRSGVGQQNRSRPAALGAFRYLKEDVRIGQMFNDVSAYDEITLQCQQVLIRALEVIGNPPSEWIASPAELDRARLGRYPVNSTSGKTSCSISSFVATPLSDVYYVFGSPPREITFLADLYTGYWYRNESLTRASVQ